MMIIILSLFLNCWASDVDQIDPYVDDFYQKGEKLVFDCVYGHFVCTSKFEYTRCSDAREKALALKSDNIRCLNIKEFKTEKICHKYQQKMTNSFDITRLCKSMEQREIDRVY